VSDHDLFSLVGAGVGELRNLPQDSLWRCPHPNFKILVQFCQNRGKKEME